MNNLEKIRQQLDIIDDNIIKDLKKRAKLIIKIRKIKIQNKIKTKDPKREKFILNKTKSPFERKIFKKILTESRKLQKAPLQKQGKM